MLKFLGGLRPLVPAPDRVPQPLTLHLAVVVIKLLGRESRARARTRGAEK